MKRKDFEAPNYVILPILGTDILPLQTFPQYFVPKHPQFLSLT
jgi:hypothetical protein